MSHWKTWNTCERSSSAVISRKFALVPALYPLFSSNKLTTPDRAELIVLWEDQAALERFNSTGMLEASVQGLAARLPGVQIQREGYLVSLLTGVQPEDLQEAFELDALVAAR